MTISHSEDPRRVRQHREVGGAPFSAPERPSAAGTPGAFGERALMVLRYLDVALVVIAMGPALALGAPVLGYTLAAVGWIVQRVLAETDRRWIRRVEEPRKQLGVSLFEAFGRIWLLAGVIIIAAVVGGNTDGLTAALVIFGAYSVAFVIKVIAGPPMRRPVQ